MTAGWYFQKRNWLRPETEKGIAFWSAMYIPIIVAMAASLNVNAAFQGGWAALLAGGAATLLGFMLVPVLSRIGRADPDEKDPKD
jgi:malonate transporter MadL subunit